MVSNGASIVLEQAAARPDARVLLRPSVNAVADDDDEDDDVEEEDDVDHDRVVFIVVDVAAKLDFEEDVVFVRPISPPPRGMQSYSADFFDKRMPLV